MKSSRSPQPWLYAAAADWLFILMPPFVALTIVVLLPPAVRQDAGMSPMIWLMLVVFIDVAHVYSTLYRTYFQKPGVYKPALLRGIPLFCYLAGVTVHLISGMLFWRLLAYLAIFHFVRQQYGFMRLYARNEQVPAWYRRCDALAIYTATIFPLLHWHLSGDRQFDWFVAGDLLVTEGPAWLRTVLYIAYLAVIALYLTKETWHLLNGGRFNVPRNVLIAGTFVSWYFGIVYFNGDLTFTMLNVISHGIPYMALVWMAEKKKKQITGNALLRSAVGRYGVPLFVLSLVVLAYVEEGLWDGLVWREHATLFGGFAALPKAEGWLLSLLVPLLALPQATHYVLDGFIWKIKTTTNTLSPTEQSASVQLPAEPV